MSEIILKGIVGSQAYGFANEHSDTDWMGIFVAPTEYFFILDKPDSVKVSKQPDTVLYEAGRFCELALSCNPSVLELLWLEGYDTMHPMGGTLVVLRHAFITRHRLGKAYLAYAHQQLQRMKQPRNQQMVDVRRMRDGLPPETDEERRAKRAKNGRHIARLILQATKFDMTGELRVRLEPHEAEEVVELGERAADGDTKLLEAMLTLGEATFARPQSESKLPEEANRYLIDRWLTNLRLNFLTADGWNS